jgi:mono/diheme cytochrome c family protein
VFTAAQARRGAAVFARHCAECHFSDEYARGYLDGWSGRSVYDLFERVRSTMPQYMPGTLPAAQYAEIIALLLEQNALPAGGADLPADAQALERIRIEGPLR